MDKKKMIKIFGGIALIVLLLIIIVTLVSTKRTEKEMVLPDHLDSSSCPQDLVPLPVLLISLDGFRPDYLDRGVTPTLNKLKEKGIFAPYLISSFPTLTFPNHYSIVTGLYPEWHGIIGNSFYDARFKARFSYKKPTSREGRWWRGEPIWNTLKKNGLLSATYFWVGSEAPIDGHHPSYWLKYNQSVPFNKRVPQIFQWLDLPPTKRPSWISLYMHEPDFTGHKFGPNSQEVNEKLREVDETLKLLLRGLIKRNLLSCVNIIIVSDHGMAPTGKDKVIHMEKYIPENLWDKIYFAPGAYGSITFRKKYKDKKEELESSFTCRKEEYQVFRREELPKRFHFSRDENIGDYVLLVEDERSVNLNSKFFMRGIHGYDNHEKSMRALFMAYGPAFKEDFVVPPFQNIELYNLMCRLLNITPAPNNGTEGVLDNMLKHVTPNSKPTKKNEKTQILKVQNSHLELNSTNFSGCDTNEVDVHKMLELLKRSERNLDTLQSMMCPWGVPQPTKAEANFSLLLHPDHITGYSSGLSMALWTSYTITKTASARKNFDWISDVRINQKSSSFSCEKYNFSKDGSNLTVMPLFLPEFSHNETTMPLVFLTSNTALFTDQMTHTWNDFLTKVITKWFSASKSPMNVIVGPVFDRNNDGLMDDHIPSSGIQDIPTDYFAVITKCTSEIQHIKDCHEEEIDTLAFVFPQTLSLKLCYDDLEEFAQLFTAQIRDVERLTGLSFFSLVKHTRKLELITKEFEKLW